jgi:outer membrane protein TolC
MDVRQRGIFVFLLCCLPLPVLAQEPCQIFFPEQRVVSVRDPGQFAPYALPTLPPPRTVQTTPPGIEPWNMSLDDAIRIALENARVIRILTGFTATNSGRTIYDPAITNTTIDQQQAAFDPTLTNRTTLGVTETPQAIPNPFNPETTLISGTRIDEFRNEFGLSQKNPWGGVFSLSWIESLDRFNGPSGPFPLNPEKTRAIQLSYTQPLLQGAGYEANVAPIVIARLNTELSFFQFKDSVQELVRGVIDAYWNLVQARTEVWARRIQVQQSEEALQRSKARLEQGRLATLGDVAQARVTYNQFRSNLILAEAAQLNRETALRSLLGLPPDDGRQIVPTSVPTDRRMTWDWQKLVQLAEQRRPDIIELKIILEADQQRLLIAQNQALPRLDAFGNYRWNGLEGEMPNGDSVSSRGGQFTSWMVGINFSVPLGLRRERAAVREQELILARDRANLEQSLHNAIHEVAFNIRDLDSLYQQFLVLKETREAAYENLKLQLEEYRARRVIYLNVLVALTDWGNAVTAEARALLDYNIALASLERRTGTILETHGVVFYEERFRAAGPLGCGHERFYPEALRPVGVPNQYPGKNEPSENYFDLRNPAQRSPDGAPLPPPAPRPR